MKNKTLTLLHAVVMFAVLGLYVGYLHWMVLHPAPQEPVVLKEIQIVEMSPPLIEELEDPYASLSAFQRRDVISRAIALKGLHPTLEPAPDTWKKNREQGVMLARICASELRGVLGPKALKWYEKRGTLTMGSYLLAHTMYNNKKNVLVKETRQPVPGWMGVMQELSPRVTGKYPPRRARQEWTSTLPSYGSGPPAGWVPKRDGDWRMFGPSWVKLRELTVAMWTRGVQAGLPYVPGGGRPKTWDMVDFESTRKRLCKLDNGDGEPLEAGGNWFWGFKGDPSCLVEVIAVAPVQQKPQQ